ncbi:MAG: hypothetical protein KAT91_04485 [Candidatus Aenigmarchaeota archaeon]|nr:hypothetical protein [Candidatus Aenigmarchaeota archaeon]
MKRNELFRKKETLKTKSVVVGKARMTITFRILVIVSTHKPKTGYASVTPMKRRRNKAL